MPYLDCGAFVCVLGASSADVRPNCRQLGLSREVGMVRWIGVPGMLWSRVLPEV